MARRPTEVLEWGASLTDAQIAAGKPANSLIQNGYGPDERFANTSHTWINANAANYINYLMDYHQLILRTQPNGQLTSQIRTSIGQNNGEMFILQYDGAILNATLGNGPIDDLTGIPSLSAGRDMDYSKDDNVVGLAGDDHIYFSNGNGMRGGVWTDARTQLSALPTSVDAITYQNLGGIGYWICGYQSGGKFRIDRSLASTVTSASWSNIFVSTNDAFAPMHDMHIALDGSAVALMTVNDGGASQIAAQTSSITAIVMSEVANVGGLMVEYIELQAQWVMVARDGTLRISSNRTSWTTIQEPRQADEVMGLAVDQIRGVLYLDYIGDSAGNKRYVARTVETLSGSLTEDDWLEVSFGFTASGGLYFDIPLTESGPVKMQLANNQIMTYYADGSSDQLLASIPVGGPAL